MNGGHEQREDFGLWLDVSGDWTVRGTKLGQEGDLTNAKLQYDDLRKRTLAVFKDLVSGRRVQSRKELEVLGEHLFAMLFVGDMWQAFWMMFRERSAERRLVVRLSFAQDAQELAWLPWEYLFAPEIRGRQGFFLATKDNLVLSRYLPVDQPTSHLPEREPLRVLLLVSEPSDAQMKHVELEQLEMTIRECANVELHISEDATLTGFTDPIARCRPHIVHMIGLGRARSPAGAEIALVDSDGTQDWVSESVFAEAVVHANWRPPVVVLQLWESSPEDGGGGLGFERLAPELVRAQIPAVVAMRHPLVDDGVEFSKWFYNYLAGGKTIEAAVHKARWMLSLKPKIPWAFGTPILFLHTIGSVIEPERTPPVELGATNPAERRSVRAPEEGAATNGAAEILSGLAPPSLLQAVAAEQQSGGAEQQSRVAEIEERANDLVNAGRERLDALAPDRETRRGTVMRLLQLKKELSGRAPAQQNDYLAGLDDVQDAVWQDVLGAMAEAALEPAGGAR
jgi:CHAT domain